MWPCQQPCTRLIRVMDKAAPGAPRGSQEAVQAPSPLLCHLVHHLTCHRRVQSFSENTHL